MKKQQAVTILGDGAFGTAFAQACALQGHSVMLWCYNANIAQEIEQWHINSHYLPDISLHQNIRTTTDLEVALSNRDIIFEAIPMEFLRKVIAQGAPFIKPTHRLISLTKGIEAESLFTATQVIQNVLPIADDQIAVLSGPSYARELAMQQPTGFVLATKNQELCACLMQLFNAPITIEPSQDVQGVQLIAALKNVVALALGLLAGSGYQSNTQMLLFMRLLQEFKLLSTLFNLRESDFTDTLYGIAGIGDMILTCFGRESRNYRFGYGIGKGKNKETIIQELGSSPEGLNTLKSIKKIEMLCDRTLPLFNCIERTIQTPSLLPELIQMLQYSPESSIFCRA